MSVSVLQAEGVPRLSSDHREMVEPFFPPGRFWTILWNVVGDPCQFEEMLAGAGNSVHPDSTIHGHFEGSRSREVNEGVPRLSHSIRPA